MDTPPSTPVSVDLITPAPKKGISVDNILKIVGLCIVVVVIWSIWSAFHGASKDPAIKNLSDAFGNTTGALAWASSNWELLLAAFLIAPLVPAAGKWVAGKMSEAEKKGISPKAKEKLADMMIFKKKTEAADQASTPEERAKELGDAKESKDSFFEDDKEAQEEAEKVGGEIGVPPIEKGRLLWEKLRDSAPTCRSSSAARLVW
jgi:hypothetical protein